MNLKTNPFFIKLERAVKRIRNIAETAQTSATAKAAEANADADRAEAQANLAIAFSQTNSYRLLLDLAPSFDATVVQTTIATFDEATTSPAIAITTEA